MCELTRPRYEKQVFEFMTVTSSYLMETSERRTWPLLCSLSRLTQAYFNFHCLLNPLQDALRLKKTIPTSFYQKSLIDVF